MKRSFPNCLPQWWQLLFELLEANRCRNLRVCWCSEDGHRPGAGNHHQHQCPFQSALQYNRAHNALDCMQFICMTIYQTTGSLKSSAVTSSSFGFIRRLKTRNQGFVASGERC